jgi:hypothetical protein
MPDDDSMLRQNEVDDGGDVKIRLSARLARAVRNHDFSVRGTREERAEHDRRELAWWRPFRQRANALFAEEEGVPESVRRSAP